MGALLLDTLTDAQQRRTPWGGGLAGARIGIGEPGITHPRDLAGEDSPLAENHDLILLPRSCCQQLVEKVHRLSTTKKQRCILHYPVSLQKWSIGLVEKGCLMPTQDQFGG